MTILKDIKLTNVEETVESFININGGSYWGGKHLAGTIEETLWQHAMFFKQQRRLRGR